MYGFTLATFRAGVHKDMLQSLNLLAHPPFDKKEFERDGLPYYILHLTYPMKYNAQGTGTAQSRQYSACRSGTSHEARFMHPECINSWDTCKATP